MFPDPKSRTVRIPIRITEGQAELFYDGPMPKLKEGAVGELVLHAHAVLDDAYREKMAFARCEELLPAGAVLLVQLSRPDSPRHLVRLNDGEFDSVDSDYFAEIKLLEPLLLHLQGTKKAWLAPCRCLIPLLATEAQSLNEAYSHISRKYEPNRRSHTGNAFRKIYYMDLIQNAWRRLEVLRDRGRPLGRTFSFRDFDWWQRGDGSQTTL